MSRRARARAGAINAKRIAFNREPETFDDDEGAAPDVHDSDHDAWAWAEAVSRDRGAHATVKSGVDTTTGASAQPT